jgi:hypothetical protein
MPTEAVTRRFTCEHCGRDISLCGPDYYTDNVCVICDWLRKNQELTAEEREQLRARLCGE